MTKTRRITALLLSLALLLALLPNAALATEVSGTAVEAVETADMEDETTEAAAADDETTAEEDVADDEETAADKETSIEEETPTEEETSIEEETSADEETAAEEDSFTEGDIEFYVNPLYEDVIDVDDIDVEAAKADIQEAVCDSDSADTTQATYQSYSNAVKRIRSYLTSRTSTFTVYYYSSSYPSKNFIISMMQDDAMAHTGVSNQGDALLWDWGYMSWSQSYQLSGSTYYVKLTYSMSYYTTSSQESWTKAKVSSIVSSLGMTGKTTYEKIKAIYDYICDNVVYDYAHLSNSSYKLQYTAYAALHNGTSVCQGYAVLFYRMALEAGIDARVVIGYAWGDSDSPHAWNIVQIGSYYYNLDSTWDAGRSTYNYFLKCPANFNASHVRSSDYTTSSFQSKYPMASSDYVYRLPLTPTLKSITNVTNGVKITWGTVSGATSYNVYRKAIGDSGWTKVGTSTTTSYTSTGVSSGVTYTFTVRAVNSYGTSGYNATGLTIRYLATPKVTLSNTTGGVKISWTKSTGATGGYYVYRRTVSGSYTKIASVSTGTLSYTDKAASAGVRYYYAVRAYSNGYLSAYASQYITRLGTPTGIAVTNVKSGVQVTWNSVKGAASYEVYRKPVGGSWSKVGTSTTTSYISTGVESGKTYTFTVKAVYNSSKSGYSSTGKTIRFLSEPTITLSNTSSGVKVSWTKSTGATDGYYVYRRTASGSYTLIAKVASGTLSYTDKAASAGVKYYYAVRAQSNGYASSYTSKFIVRLGHPTLTLTSASTGVKLSWTKVTGCTGYCIYRKTGSGSYTKLTTVSGADSVTWTDTTARKGVTYTYYVQAYQGSSVSSYTAKSITR
ncbi:MAG: hypothetical protein LUC39_07270 [Clostridiales bacterium]|nr:hypothetical protein [Clostridiales bacterium]